MNEQYLCRYLLGKARQAFKWWDAREEARRRAQLYPGIEICAGCECAFYQEEKVLTEDLKVALEAADIPVFMEKTDVDHIECVVEPDTGFSGYDNYYKRLYCNVENLQVLCKACHYSKTHIIEKEERMNRK